MMELSNNATAIKEAFFAAGNNMLRVVTGELATVYPVTCRMQTFPTFMPHLKAEYDTKFAKARNFLYEQRNLVQRKWLPRYHIERGLRQETVDNAELKAVLIDGALDRLYENLVAYLPILLPMDKCPGVAAAIKNVYENEAKDLEKFLRTFNAKRTAGTELIEKELD